MFAFLENIYLPEVSSDGKLQYSSTRTNTLLAKESVEENETIEEVDTFEARQALVSSNLHVENAVCDLSYVINVENNSSNVSEAQKDITCNLCEFTTHHIDSYLLHIKHCHSDIDKLPEKCVKCGMQFCQHDEQNPNLEKLHVVLYPCMLCDNKFQAASSLRKHVRDNHRAQQKRNCNFCRMRLVIVIYYNSDVVNAPSALNVPSSMITYKRTKSILFFIFMY